MLIYVDESGSFVPVDRPNRWSVVGAYLIPETGQHALSSLAHGLRSRLDARELKFRNVPEAEYVWFLNELARLPGIVIAQALSMTASSSDSLARHRERLAANCESNVDRLVHASMREALTDLARRLRDTNDQRYAQLVLQLNLFHCCIRDGISYFVQREPQTLQRFTWRVDNKDDRFNSQIDRMAAAHIQSCSLHDGALPILEGEDYSALARFRFSRGSGPNYLNETYGLNVDVTKGLNLGRMLSEDFSFVDSQTDDGVQIADLVVGGIRRSLQQEFNKNLRAGRLLGRIMVQQPYNGVPIVLQAFSDADDALARGVKQTVRAMWLNVRPFNQFHRGPTPTRSFTSD